MPTLPPLARSFFVLFWGFKWYHQRTLSGVGAFTTLTAAVNIVHIRFFAKQWLALAIAAG